MYPLPQSAQIDIPPVDRPFVNATLPVELDDGMFLESNAAREFGKSLSASYQSASPFPHIVIDGFLPDSLADALLANFPSDPRANDVLYADRVFEHKKRQILPKDCNENARRIFSFLNSGPVLEFLESLTMIEGLIADPYFDGGGFHEISRGGKLGIHADFRINRRLNLQRRLNLLLYLNKDWVGGYGGRLELWDKAVKRMVHSIAPLFNRCVIFSTGKDSYHGHPDLLNVPASVTRKSAALYYYTASKKIYEELAAHGTVFAARPSDSQNSKRIALRMKLRTLFSVPEILPPIIYRPLRALKHRIMGPR